MSDSRRSLHQYLLWIIYKVTNLNNWTACDCALDFTIIIIIITSSSHNTLQSLCLAHYTHYCISFNVINDFLTYIYLITYKQKKTEIREISNLSQDSQLENGTSQELTQVSLTDFVLSTIAVYSTISLNCSPNNHDFPLIFLASVT